METQTWAREMALYGKWQNDSLFGLCGNLSEEARSEDRGMFFGSILATLDHALMVDVALRAFFADDQPPTDFDPNRRVHTGFEALREARSDFDVSLLARIDSEAADWLDQPLTFESERLAGTISLPRLFYAAQMFNHGTHHRSQVTAELHRMGIDYGITDLPYNPLSQFWSAARRT